MKNIRRHLCQPLNDYIDVVGMAEYKSNQYAKFKFME